MLHHCRMNSHSPVCVPSTYRLLLAPLGQPPLPMDRMKHPSIHFILCLTNSCWVMWQFPGRVDMAVPGASFLQMPSSVVSLSPYSTTCTTFPGHSECSSGVCCCSRGDGVTTLWLLLIALTASNECLLHAGLSYCPPLAPLSISSPGIKVLLRWFLLLNVIY